MSLRGTARLGKDPRGTACHFRCGAAGESQEQDATRIGALEDKVSDPVSKRVRLAGPSACDDQKRAARAALVEAVFDCGPLTFVQAHKWKRVLFRRARIEVGRTIDAH